MTGTRAPIGKPTYAKLGKYLAGLPCMAWRRSEDANMLDRAGSLFKHARSQLRDKAAATLDVSIADGVSTAREVCLLRSGMHGDSNDTKRVSQLRA